WTHVTCIQHGMYRIGIAEEQDEYPCPVCQKSCKAAVIATGLTRDTLPTLPRLIIKALSLKSRAMLLVEEPERPRIRRRRKDYHHGQKIRRLTRQILSTTR